METKKKTNITLIGSGLAGSFLAVLLAKRGYNIALYERLSRQEICDEASKRSYNIVLFGYGINVLKEAGLWDVIKPHLFPLKGSVTHIASHSKPVITLTDDKKAPYFTISRAIFADILLKEATSHPAVTLHDNTSLLAVDRRKKIITVKTNKTNKILTLPFDILIGADGANSLIRPILQQGQTTHHKQEYAQWTYKQFALTPELVEKLKLEKKFVHIWTQQTTFIIAHPDGDDSLSAMIVIPKNLPKVLNSAQTVRSFVTENFLELSPAVEKITEDILKNPDGNFATILTAPWYYKNFIAIIGDAAHGFYPFFGQGTSAAFSDCMELCKLIDMYGSDWGKIFPLYQENRKKHTDALAALSKEAFIKNLRFKKADYDAVYDKLQTIAHQFFPKVIYPPLSQTITTDPSHAADHQKRYYGQRKLANKLGVSLLVKSVAHTLELYTKSVKKSNK